MPLTKAGRKTKRAFLKQYGKKRGASFFYAKERKGGPGVSKWTRKKRGRKSR
jgi:hypothetical protein